MAPPYKAHPYKEYYVVAVGDKPGIYPTWNKCNEAKGSGPGKKVWRKFQSEKEAIKFYEHHNSKNLLATLSPSKRNRSAGPAPSAAAQNGSSAADVKVQPPEDQGAGPSTSGENSNVAIPSDGPLAKEILEKEQKLALLRYEKEEMLQKVKTKAAEIAALIKEIREAKKLLPRNRARQ